MKAYIYIAIGGFIGAISRFVIKNIHILDYRGDFPLNTLLINLTGSLILAFVLALSSHLLRFDKDIKMGITVGFLGAYTTFSTLCKELSNLLEKQNFGIAFIYLTASIMLGLIAVYVGVLSANMIFVKMKRGGQKREKEDVEASNSNKATIEKEVD